MMLARRDGRAVHSWVELQRIKDDLAGAERVAVEVYPARSRLVDDVNVYHLWVLPNKVREGFPLDLSRIMQRLGR